MDVMSRCLPVVVFVVALAAAGEPRAVQSPEHATGLAGEGFAMRVIADGLADPFQIVWGPDDYLWVTERTAGRITRVRPPDGAKSIAIAIGGVPGDNGNGLLGMALDPGLLKGSGNDFVYAVHSYNVYAVHASNADARPDTVDRRTKVVRLTYDAASHTLAGPRDILANLPAGDDHQGGRIAFGPDRKLYVSIGDQGANQLANYCNPNHAQDLPTAAQVQAHDWSMYVGKILRMNLDGSIPADNPTLQGVRSHVYSYGHRNPQGLVFAPDGKLYESEHGPNTDDEVNLIRAGRNYEIGRAHV